MHYSPHLFLIPHANEVSHLFLHFKVKISTFKGNALVLKMQMSLVKPSMMKQVLGQNFSTPALLTFWAGQFFSSGRGLSWALWNIWQDVGLYPLDARSFPQL